MLRGSVLLLVALTACGAALKPTPLAPVVRAPPVAAADPAAAPLPLWPMIKKGTLSNGLTYYILKHDKPEKRALLWLAVNAGSLQEDADQRGLAHFDEHMAFNGTKSFPKNAIVDYLEKIGMRFGADLNAYTNYNETVYQLEVPTDEPEFVGKGLDILRDWAGSVSYEPAEVEKERGVVKEEWRLGRGASRRLHDKQEKVLLAGTRYVERDTIGLPEIIDHAPRERLMRFYEDWYRPDLMAVIAVGDLDPDRIEREIQARFSGLTGPKVERPRIGGGVPKANGTRISIETDKEAQATVVAISNLVPHRFEESLRDYRRHAVESLYTSVLNARLQSIARKPGAPFAFAAGATSLLERDIDSFDRIAMVKGDDVLATLRALFTEVLRIERHGISAPELERARKKMMREYEQMAETEATADARQFAEELTRHFFMRELVIGSAAEKKLMLDILPTITVAELDVQLKTFGGEENRAVLVSAPEGKKLPTKEDVLGLLNEVTKTDVSSWAEKAAALALMATAPRPGKVVAEKRIEAINVTEWTLSNGVHVVVKPTNFELDSVVLNGTSAGGLAMASDKEFGNARFAQQVAAVGGVGELDGEALEHVLAGKQVRVAASIGETTESVTGRGSAHDLETMLQLVHLQMTAPRKDAEAFVVWQQNSADRLTEMLRAPEALPMIEAQDALWKGNLRKKIPTAAEVRQVDLEKALAFYRRAFANASGFTFVIVGSVGLDKLKPLVETYLASLPTTGRREQEKDLHVRRVGGVVKKEWKAGQEPKATVSLLFHADEAWTRDKDRDLAILGMVLSLKLRAVLREDLGGVYGVGAAGSFQRTPHMDRAFSVTFGCDPKRVDELVKATFAVVAKLATDGPGADTLGKVRSTYVRSRETDLRRNDFWGGWLANAARFGDDPTLVLDIDKVTARMTAANVKAAAKHYLDGKQYFESVTLPAAP